MWRTTMHAAALAAALATAGSAAAKAPPRVTGETSETYGCTTKRNRGTEPELVCIYAVSDCPFPVTVSASYRYAQHKTGQRRLKTLSALSLEQGRTLPALDLPGQTQGLRFCMNTYGKATDPEFEEGWSWSAASGAEPKKAARRRSPAETRVAEPVAVVMPRGQAGYATDCSDEVSTYLGAARAGDASRAGETFRLLQVTCPGELAAMSAQTGRPVPQDLDQAGQRLSEGRRVGTPEALIDAYERPADAQPHYDPAEVLDFGVAALGLATVAAGLSARSGAPTVVSPPPRNRGTAPSGTPGNPNRSDISGTGR